MKYYIIFISWLLIVKDIDTNGVSIYDVDFMVRVDEGWKYNCVVIFYAISKSYLKKKERSQRQCTFFSIWESYVKLLDYLGCYFSEGHCKFRMTCNAHSFSSTFLHMKWHLDRMTKNVQNIMSTKNIFFFFY